LQGHKFVIHHHLLCEKVGADGSFVLVAELLIHILIHKRGLANPTKRRRTIKNCLPLKKAEAYPLSPKMMIFNKTFLRVDILSCLVVLQLNKYDSLKVLALLYFPSFPQLLLRMTRSRLAFGQKHTLYGVGATRRSGSRQLLLHLATPLNE